MLAHVRRVDVARNANGFDFPSWSDSRQQQQVRGSDRPPAHYDFLGRGDGTFVSVGRPVLDAGRDLLPCRTFQDHARCLRVGDDREVRSSFGFALEKRMVGTRPLALAGRGLEQGHDAACTTAGSSVVIAAGNPARHGGVHELPRPRKDWRAHGDAERTVCVMRVTIDRDVVARREPLALLEVRQHLAVAPSDGAAFGPAVEIAGMTAYVCHVVDPGRSAEHLASRHHHAPFLQSQPALACIGRVHPVCRRVLLQQRTGSRNRFLRGWASTRFEQRDATGRIFRETSRNDRSGGSGPDHDEIECLWHGRSFHVSVIISARKNNEHLLPWAGCHPPKLLSLPKTETTWSTTAWCSVGTSALPATGAMRAMRDSFPLGVTHDTRD